MKANRKFRTEEEAVSPVIAVILMVAITVVLAATVYVWVSGFGSQSSQPAKTMSLTSSGAIDTNGDKEYTVASATSGMRWSDITLTIDGVSWAFTGTCSGAITGSAWMACSGGSTEASTATISAGDSVRVGNIAAGQTLRILDSQANSVILSVVVG